MRIVVIGAGIAGAAAAWHLAEYASVVMVEREAHPGAHATGRSAALHTETSGTPVVAALAATSRPFLAQSAGGVHRPWAAVEEGPAVDRPRPRAGPAGGQGGCRGGGRRGGAPPRFEAVLRAGRRVAPRGRGRRGLRAGRHDHRRGRAAAGFRAGRPPPGRRVARGGCGHRCHRARWRLAGAGRRAAHWDCDVVVDAAGAWCDPVAQLAGVEPLGLRPLRRSVFVFPPPAGTNAAGWPMVWDIGNRFYFEPEGPLLLASPADETPSEPCDARPQTDRHRAGRRGTGGGHHPEGSGCAPHLGRTSHVRARRRARGRFRPRPPGLLLAWPVRAATASRPPRLSGGWRRH